MRYAAVFVFLLTACTSEKKLDDACKRGDPSACDALSTRYRERAMALCQDAGPGSAETCEHYTIKAMPLDMPKTASSGDIQTVFSVVLVADGTTQIDGKVVANDDAILPLARAAHERNPELRAVIKGDASVTHGRVIHVLDLLKMAGVSKIAFGVKVTPPTPPVPSQ